MGPLRFKLLGAEIHFRPEFWLVVLFLAFSTQRSLGSQFALVLTLLVTILVHELGHAIVARRLGLNPIVSIHGFGGQTSYVPSENLTRGTAIRISLAGPASGMATALLGLGVYKLVPLAFGVQWSETLATALVEFVQVNAFWSVVNLLPVMPFDGGQVLVLLLGPERRVLAARLSLLCGCLVALGLFAMKLPVAAFVFAMAAVLQYVAFSRVQSIPTKVMAPREVQTVIDQAKAALDAGDHAGAARLSRVVIELSPTAVARRKAAELYAWASLGSGELVEARRALQWLSDGAIDPLLQAALLEADGDDERATACLRQALVAGDERPQLAASLVRLLLRAERYGEAALTTIQILDHVSAEEARQVISACKEGGRPVPGAELAEALYALTGEASDLLRAVDCHMAAGDKDAARAALSVGLSTKLTASAVEQSSEWTTLASDPELAAILARSRG